VRIQKASPDTFARRLPEVIRLYTDEYRLSPAAAREREAIMLRHIGRRRFVAFLALDGDDLLGFTYGYAGGPGEYWYDLVYEAMPPAMREAWLGEHFEFVELLVAPEARGRGLGGRLHDSLLEGRPEPVALLTVRAENALALGLYRKRGWEVLLDDFRFSRGGERFYVMGKRLMEAR